MISIYTRPAALPVIFLSLSVALSRTVAVMKICPTCQNCFEDTVDLCSDDQTLLATSRPGSRLIAQKYSLDQLIKCDDLEAEYAATRLTTDQPVAIKLLPPSPVPEAEALKSFRREANAVAHLNTRVEHQYVVKTFDYGTLPNDAAYVVTELVAGQPLGEYIRDGGPLPVAAAIRIARQVADGLAAAHRCGVVHSDLNPSKIIITRDYRNRPEVKIVDFGFARLREHLPAEFREHTPAAPLHLHQNPYASPEQRARHHLDARSDVYSLGVILFEMLAARLPFKIGADGDLAQELVSLQHFNSNVSMSLDELVMAALHPKAAARLSSAGEFARQLRDIESGNGPNAQSPEQASFAEAPPAAAFAAHPAQDVSVNHSPALQSIAALPDITPAPDSLPSRHESQIIVVDVTTDEEIKVDDDFREFPQAVTDDLLVSRDDPHTEYAALTEEEFEKNEFIAYLTRKNESPETEEIFWHDLSPAPPLHVPVTNGHAAVRIKSYVDAPRYKRHRRPVVVYAVCAAVIILGCIGGVVLALRLVSPTPPKLQSSVEPSMNVRAAQQVIPGIYSPPPTAPAPTPENSPPAATDSPVDSEADILKAAEAAVLSSLTPAKSPTPPVISQSVKEDLKVDGDKVFSVNSDGTTIKPEASSSLTTEPRPSLPAPPLKTDAAAKAGPAEDSVRCDLSVNRDTLEVSSSGGSGSVMATLNHSSGSAMGVSATTPDWSDIVVFSEPQLINDNTSLVKYSVKSISRKAGTYHVQLKSRCGSKSLTVQVR